MKIIQIVENLDKGAVENWLVGVFLESRKIHPNWKWSFYCILGRPGRLDDRVREAGGEIIYAPVAISQKIRFLSHLRSVLKKGHFDIIHAHHDYLSGFYLLATIGIPFEKRILHIHNTEKSLPVGSRFLEKLLTPIFKRLDLYFSDIIIGISQHVINEFKGSTNDRQKFKVLYYGINFSDFESKNVEMKLRKELKLPTKAKIMLFVGRLDKNKNPQFIIDILAEILKKNTKNIYAVFVGIGEEEKNIKEKAKKLGLESQIRLLGWRNDVPALMQNADVFIFPRVESIKEGLGIVVLQAQAAGLPMVLSRGIVSDAIVVNNLVHVIPLADNPQEWANKIFTILNRPLSLAQKTKAFQKMQQSAFSLRSGTKNLLKFYEK